MVNGSCWLKDVTEPRQGTGRLTWPVSVGGVGRGVPQEPPSSTLTTGSARIVIDDGS